MEFTHFDEQGNARMVDVSGKEVTHRVAVAEGIISVSREVMDAIKGNKVKKGDVLTVSQVAGIMGTKRTPDLIPMCHPLSLTNAEVSFEVDEEVCEIRRAPVHPEHELHHASVLRLDAPTTCRGGGFLLR